MPGTVRRRKPCTVLLALVVFGFAGGILHAQELPRDYSPAPDTAGAGFSVVSVDSLHFADFLLLGSRDLGEVARWLPGHYLLRYGGFGQASQLVEDGLFRVSLGLHAFLDPAVSPPMWDWSTWPAGTHALVAPVEGSTYLAGPPSQLLAEFPWKAPCRPYTRVGYTTGAYGLSQVAVRFTEKVHPGVRLWVEGAHDLYGGYELFSGLRNQLYVWRVSWTASPTWRVRYWGRHYARDVDSPDPGFGLPIGNSLRFSSSPVAKHQKNAWTDHILEATWVPDSLGKRELTVTVAGGWGRAERSYWDASCPASVSELREGQVHVLYRRNGLRISGSLTRFAEELEGGGEEATTRWQTRMLQRLSGAAGWNLEFGGGLAGGVYGAFGKTEPEAVLALTRTFRGVRTRIQLSSDTWLCSPDVPQCSRLDSHQASLVRRTKAAVRLRGGATGWAWFAEIGAVRAASLPGVGYDEQNGWTVPVSERSSATLTLAVARAATHTVFGRAKVDFYANPLPGLPRVYSLAALGVRRVLFQGDLDVRLLGLVEFISRRTPVLPLGSVGYADFPSGFSVPAGTSPSVRVVVRFKDANLFFQVTQLFDRRLERAPGFPDDPLSYRWGVWWEFWD